MEIENLFKQISEKSPVKPRKKRMHQYYSSEYFSVKVKPTFEARWASYNALPPVEGVKPMKRLDFQNKVTKEFWEAESPAFQDWLEKQRDAAHDQAMGQYQKNLDDYGHAVEGTGRTAETYHKWV